MLMNDVMSVLWRLFWLDWGPVVVVLQLPIAERRPLEMKVLPPPARAPLFSDPEWGWPIRPEELPAALPRIGGF